MMFFSVLLVAFLSSSFTHIEKAVDNDVGYSLTLDQDITVIPTISVPVISGESSILIDRGVSVPYLGLITSEFLIYNNSQKQVLNDMRTDARSWQESGYPTNSNIGLNQLRGVNTRLTDYKLMPKT